MTLGIVIANMKHVLNGYEKKIDCIWGSTGPIINDAAHTVFNETDKSVHNFYSNLRDANFATALESALEPTLEIGRSVHDAIDDIANSLEDLPFDAGDSFAGSLRDADPFAHLQAFIAEVKLTKVIDTLCCIVVL